MNENQTNADPDDGLTATDLLRADHEKVSELFDRYETALEEESGDRRAIAEQICTELEIHSEIEEEIFYPRVREQDQEEEDLVDEAYEEHKDIKECIEELRQLSPDDEEYDATVLKMMDIVEHHVEEEETNMFPEVEEKMADSLEALGAEILRRKQELAAAKQ